MVKSKILDKIMYLVEYRSKKDSNGNQQCFDIIHYDSKEAAQELMNCLNKNLKYENDHYKVLPIGKYKIHKIKYGKV